MARTTSRIDIVGSLGARMHGTFRYAARPVALRGLPGQEVRDGPLVRVLGSPPKPCTERPTTQKGPSRRTGGMTRDGPARVLTARGVYSPWKREHWRRPLRTAERPAALPVAKPGAAGRVATISAECEVCVTAARGGAIRSLAKRRSAGGGSQAVSEATLHRIQRRPTAASVESVCWTLTADRAVPANAFEPGTFRPTHHVLHLRGAQVDLRAALGATCPLAATRVVDGSRVGRITFRADDIGACFVVWPHGSSPTDS